jgi:hypothetical protein
MAIVPVADAVFGEVAESAENNKIIDNVIDLDARLGPVVAASTAHARLTTLEARTTDTGTAPGGIGNQRLADRFGTGVGTSTNVTTGTATAQLADIRTRLTNLEGGSGGGIGAWVTISSFSNGWNHRPGAYQNLQVRTLPGGNIQIIGVIQTGSSGGALANGATLFSLPNSTYYPEEEVWIPCGDSGGNPRYVRIANGGTGHIFAATNVTNTLFIYGIYPSASATP